MIRLKRVYEPAAKDDGFRILVERLWPRGLSKRRAQVDLWLKKVAPSAELRTWYAHDVKKWKEFQKRYRAELRSNDAVKELRIIGARDGEIPSQADVVRMAVMEKLDREKKTKRK